MYRHLVKVHLMKSFKSLKSSQKGKSTLPSRHLQILNFIDCHIFCGVVLLKKHNWK